MDDSCYSIREVAQRFDIPVSTLRYYDTIGLLAPTRRRGNVRYYSREALHRLALIQRLHHRGTVSLTDTADLLNDAARESANWHTILRGTAQDLRDRIHQLRQSHEAIQHLLVCPDPDPIGACPYLRDQLAEVIDAAFANPQTT